MNNYLKILLLVLSILILDVSFVHPQSQEYTFRHLTTKDGLPCNVTTSVFKDSRGFIWIATTSGLCRYDGSFIKVFSPDPRDTSSLPDNTSHLPNIIAEDHDGYLWIATLDGLCKYDPARESFHVYKHNPDDFNSLSTNELNCLFVDRPGTLWAGSGYGNGLNKYNVEEDNFTRLEVNTVDDTVRIRKSVNALYEDSKGIFWVGTSHGLYQFDREDEVFIRMDKPPETFAADNPVLFVSIFEGEDGTLYFGTLNGLLTYHQQEKILVPLDAFYDTDYDFVHSMDMDQSVKEKDHPVWITAKYLYRYDTHEGSIRQIIVRPEDTASLKSIYSYSVLVDNTGLIWVTGSYGINILNPFYYRMERNPEFAKSYGRLQALLEDSKGDFWIGTSRFLLHCDGKKHPIHKYNSPYFNILDNEGLIDVSSIYEDREQNIWVGTSYGLYLLDKGKDKFYPCTFTGTKKDIPHRIYEIFQDSRDVMWVCTYPYGLYEQENGGSSITHFTYDSLRQAIGAPIVNDIFEDSAGNLWICTGKGIFFQSASDKGTYKFTHFLNDPYDNKSIGSNIIHAMIQDGLNRIWIATQNGLYKYLGFEEGFKRYLDETDPGSNLIYGLTDDSTGNLWLSTESGLVRFRPDVFDDDHSTNRGRNLVLPFDEYNRFALFTDNRGKIYLGSEKYGYCWFYPDSLKDNELIPPICIVDFTVNGDHYKTDSSITLKKHLVLKHSQNFFSFKFAALDYTEPGKNQFAYFLEGLEDDWNYCGNISTANYTGVPPGVYKFRVKGSNNDGYWNEEGTNVYLTILPPPWKTWWAYVSYAALFVIVIYFSVRYYLRRQKLVLSLELKEIQARKLEELDHMKSRFFANISHEFRTPLMLILGPLDKLIKKIKEEEDTRELNMMQRNAQRLQRLINQLLDLAKFESGKMKLQATETDLVAFTRRYIQSFESLAKHRDIRLEFNSAQELINVWIDREKMQQVLGNLLSNAFKFTTAGGRVAMKVGSSWSLVVSQFTPLSPPSRGDSISSPTIGGDQGGVVISISDTGPGISPEHLPHIFDRFYRVDDSISHEQKGTGIGLALAKELVELHHGVIRVESEVGVGTTFSIYLLLGKEHLTEEEKGRRGEAEKDTSKQLAVGSSQSDLTPFIPQPPVPPLLEERGPGGEVEPETWNLEPETRNQKPETEKSPLGDLGVEKPLLLIVEDNPDMRSFIREYLVEDYRVLEAEDGEKGLEMAAEHIPDLIVSDVMMPVMDGYALCNNLKTDERTSHIPVIMLTARAGKESKIKGLETGADDFITKPFDVEELLVRISNLIDQRKKLQDQIMKNAEKMGLSKLLKLPASGISSMDQQFLSRAMAIIEEHLDDFEFNVAHFAGEMHLSQMQVYRKLKALIYLSPNELIRSVRLSHAAEMILHKAGNIAQIAYAVGFNNPSYFARCFKEKFGVLPSDYVPES